MNKEAALYTEKIFSSFLYWKHKLGVKRYYDYDAYDLGKKIKEIVVKIIEKNNQFLLTDDLIRFITFRGFCNLKYVDEFLNQFRGLIDLDYMGCRDLISGYYDHLLYGISGNSFDGCYEYIRLMKGTSREIFIKMMTKIKSLEETLNENDFIKIRELIIKIAAYCFIRNDSNLLDKVLNKYFNDITNTIDRFKLYGIISDDSSIKVDFIDFVNLDLDKNEQGVITK